MKGKKKRAVKEPEYFRSATNIPTLNYQVYYMKPLEKIGTFALAFLIGACVGYLFYGGIGKDEFGQPTTTTWVLDSTISVVVGLILSLIHIYIVPLIKWTTTCEKCSGSCSAF